MDSGQMGGQGMMGGGMGRRLDQDGCVLTCTAADCAYNQELECYAQQIQVGDDHPTCDTYTHDAQAHPRQQEGVVAMCGVAQCNFNQEQECHARGITVEMHSRHADCATFRP